MPQRIQLHRTKGWRKPEGAIVVTRPGRWGNPYPVNAYIGPEQAVARFRFAVENGLPGVPTLEEVRMHLAGRDLACWCPAEQPCHADVLLEFANQGSEDEVHPLG